MIYYATAHKLLKLLLENKDGLEWGIIYYDYRLKLINGPIQFPKGMEEKDFWGKDIPFYLSLLNRNYGQGCVSYNRWGVDRNYCIQAKVKDYFKAMWVDWVLEQTMHSGSKWL